MTTGYKLATTYEETKTFAFPVLNLLKPQIIKSCKNRFTPRRVIIVENRGMVNEKTISVIEEAGHDIYWESRCAEANRSIQEEVLTRAGRYRSLGITY